ncbi:hypothetical protein UY3_06175 [Chelonia mydas]|uniref:Uncharacterized protein n=1 Tax=Chelonia mydas TaxID=8469 RepID=M7C7R8_CHEMY|nr:hypothetical protein UY3_06175 [Chelonia mydas]
MRSVGAIPECSIVTALDSTFNSDALARYTGKAPGTFEFHFLCGQRGELISTGGAPTTTPPLSMDTCKGGVSRNRDEDFGDQEDDDEEDSAQQANGETVLPNSQERFITLEPIPSQPSQGGLPDHKAGKGTSDFNKYELTFRRQSPRLKLLNSTLSNFIDIWNLNQSCG